MHRDKYRMFPRIWCDAFVYLPTVRLHQGKHTCIFQRVSVFYSESIQPFQCIAISVTLLCNSTPEHLTNSHGIWLGKHLIFLILQMRTLKLWKCRIRDFKSISSGDKFEVIPLFELIPRIRKQLETTHSFMVFFFQEITIFVSSN